MAGLRMQRQSSGGGSCTHLAPACRPWPPSRPAGASSCPCCPPCPCPSAAAPAAAAGAGAPARGSAGPGCAAGQGRAGRGRTGVCVDHKGQAACGVGAAARQPCSVNTNCGAALKQPRAAHLRCCRSSSISSSSLSSPSELLLSLLPLLSSSLLLPLLLLLSLLPSSSDSLPLPELPPPPLLLSCSSSSSELKPACKESQGNAAPQRRHARCNPNRTPLPRSPPRVLPHAAALHAGLCKAAPAHLATPGPPPCPRPACQRH